MEGLGKGFVSNLTGSVSGVPGVGSVVGSVPVVGGNGGVEGVIGGLPVGGVPVVGEVAGNVSAVLEGKLDGSTLTEQLDGAIELFNNLDSVLMEVSSILKKVNGVDLSMVDSLKDVDVSGMSIMEKLGVLKGKFGSFEAMLNGLQALNKII